ncbi:MAG: phosphate transport system regulatory protein PhoU [Candidatus Omnitrophica bacterium CG11_big_fil_rev_8_21_14_0_20_64_10]|nr:MAG: phosphate transport system regulatory protein PhoU [Candidatus Omnitrophica bacterium CG11_big_fil_rev_8_21_14_0_20_64_10]
MSDAARYRYPFMIHRHFDEELAVLKEKLLSMGGLAEQAIGKATEAFLKRDGALAQSVIEEDAAINRTEVDLEESCLSLFARFQPEAKDLRFMAMAFKIIDELERVADQAVNIAERTLDLARSPVFNPPSDIATMSTLAMAMLKDSLDAFVNGNADLASEVCQRDEEVDQLNRVVHDTLLERAGKESAGAKQAVDQLLVARHLERVADHATNIAEDVYFIVRGRTIKHRLGAEA